MSNAPVAGTGNAANSQQTPAPGSMFNVPKYSTQPRFVLDNQNQSLGFTPNSGSQINVPTGRLDQLDIVRGIKVYASIGGTWTASAPGALKTSPFFPANIVQAITFKLQAAYNTFNLTGPLAAIMQAYRPMWASKGMGLIKPNAFATIGPDFVSTDDYVANFGIDIPMAVKFDEYYDLNAAGDPTRKVVDAYVTPMFMAAQARVVIPTITIAPQLGVTDLLGAPVARAANDSTSTYVGDTASLYMKRDAWWTASNPAGNPPQYPWLYTRDYFTQPTQGQGKVGVLIQNTGVSVGQVLSLACFVWDPSANGGYGAVVPMADIETIELVTGGSLQNDLWAPQDITDRMQSDYGDAIVGNMPDGVFVIEKGLSSDGTFFTNKNAINTYLVNGVQVNVTFKAGHTPGPSSTVYVGVEALKLATS